MKRNEKEADEFVWFHRPEYNTFCDLTGASENSPNSSDHHADSDVATAGFTGRHADRDDSVD
jgi:hypothetical protein